MDSLRTQAGACGHRGVLVLSGDVATCRQRAVEWLEGVSSGNALWVGGPALTRLDTVPWEKARSWLGRELSILVVDAFAGFDADGFAALSGTLRAGGLLLLLVPPLAEWGAYADPQRFRLASWPYPEDAVGGRFLQRFGRCIREQSGVMVWSLDEGVPAFDYPHVEPVRPALVVAPFAHPEQQAAVAAIQHVLHGHRRRPLLLTADRGRGKSAALGIAAAELLAQGIGPILLTAPGLAAVGQVFEHAARLLPDAELAPGRLSWAGADLQFVAPDALLQQLPRAALLLVDEAAAIPLAMLETMVHHYARIVFASTVHGYEGSGRGFTLRFSRRLDRLAPGWQSLRIRQAVRWSDGDPLEALCLQGLLLDAEAVEAGELMGLEPDDCHCEWLQPDHLMGNENDLRQLFGLLQYAHYRTSPNDLRQILDAPDLSIAVLRWRGLIVATMLLCEEGGLDESLASLVYSGERRLRGHLLAQSLAHHAGFAEAACLRGSRVIRLAVHPACQRQGLGRRLLSAARERYSERDYLGASFGASTDLLAFWQHEGMFPVRLGLKREASSGAHALMVLQPLSARANALYPLIRRRFCQQLPVLLREPLGDLEVELVITLLASCELIAELDEQDWRDIHSFAWGKRGYEVCMAALQKLVLTRIAILAQLDTVQQTLLVTKVLQQQAWSPCIAQAGLTGKAEAVMTLREAIRALLQSDADHACLPSAI